MPLSDLIHQVPRLLELMPSECLAALLATSRTHRSQIHNYVTSITISDPTHASDLISSTWPRLMKWTLADQDSYRILIRVTCDMTVAAASVLAKASMLSDWQLQFEGIQLSAAAAAETAKGDWPTLRGLHFGCCKLTRAVVQELVAGNWPTLTCLSAIQTPVDIGLISLLSQARWPKLAFMSLRNLRLPMTQEGKEVENQFYSTAPDAKSKVVLEADPQQTSASSSATSDWSSIAVVNLSYQQVDPQMVTKLLHTGVKQLRVLMLHCAQLDAAVILQLTQSECPRLQTLILSRNELGSVAMSYLAQGKWPLLEKLNLQGNDLEDAALDDLFKGEWQLLDELKLTVRSLHDKAITKWLGLSSDDVREALRQPQQDVQVNELKIKFGGSNADMQLPLQHIEHLYPRLATVTLYPPRP